MLDFAGSPQPDIGAEALEGLSNAPKTLPPKLFYDAEGCRLFERITQLPEYYLTRVENRLLHQVARQLRPRPHRRAEDVVVPSGAALVEYGASSETKAAILLGQLDIAAYVPIDVCSEALVALAGRMGAVSTHPVVADFLAPLSLPAAVDGMPKLGFFPGSTIGNLSPEVAIQFLRQARQTLGHGSLFMVGIDLRKDEAVLLPAYDDAEGVTAAFNRNLLVRLNREAGANFDVPSFAHEARWNDADSRIEMHLVSRRDQDVCLMGRTIRFAAGESIHTENSYKHTVPAFHALARSADWHPVAGWSDPKGWFSLQLIAAGGST